MKERAVTRDIVCGMGVEEEGPATFVKTFLGRTFFFCSAECMLIFSKSPVEFLARTYEVEETALDFVCGTNVEKNDAAYVHAYKGITFYFCSEACKEQFEHDPKEFVGS